jgi:hypothetical protein
MSEERLVERVRQQRRDAAQELGQRLRSVVLAAASALGVWWFGPDLLIHLFSLLGLEVRRSDTTWLVVMTVWLCGLVLVPALGIAFVQAVIWVKAHRIGLRIARRPELAALLVPPASGQLAALKAVAGHGRAVRRIALRLLVVGAAATAVIWVAVLIARQSSSASGWVPGLTAFFGAVVLVLVVALTRRIGHWRTARQVRKLSENPALAANLSVIGPDVDGRRAERVPALTVEFTRPRPRMRGAGRVSAGFNVLNRRPVQIAYLRLFENQARTRDFLRGAWREAGHVHLLRSAASISPAELRAARRASALDTLLVASPRVFRQRLAERPTTPLEPGDHRLTAVTDLPLKVHDPHGSYPVTSVLCHNSFWQMAVDLLLARADLTVLDLSGYRPANTGTQFELQRIVDRVPLGKAVLLCDERSDREFLEAQIRYHWAQMAAGSPNSTAGAHRIEVWVTDTLFDYRGPMKWTRGFAEQRRATSRWMVARVLGLTGDA